MFRHLLRLGTHGCKWLVEPGEAGPDDPPSEERGCLGEDVPEQIIERPQEDRVRFWRVADARRVEAVGERELELRDADEKRGREAAARDDAAGGATFSAGP